MPAFHDHFSARAPGYARFRPTYPDALFRWLAGLAPGRALAWDCATGSGQAAAGLVRHFDRVVATDASAAQIAHAQPRANIEYRVAPAERSGLDAASTDLVTVAQALHWLSVDEFYAEARRVLRPRGVIAVWCYGDASLDDPELVRLLGAFTRETVAPYWPPERRHLDAGYRTLPFPFDQLESPTFTLELAVTLAELTGYLRTWSATQRFVAAHGLDPVEAVEEALRVPWGDPAVPRTLRWPLALRVGRAG
ncbi:MAG: class I SAM-dependent methyltransferase [Gemmatimonadota bacterium]|nr:class I SAM-dependent methyltransferase [Gemmatimonadota bacterium]